VTELPELSAVQKDRLALQVKLTAAAYGELLKAEAFEVSKGEMHSASANYYADLNYYHELQQARGLMPGDRIRIVVDGPYKGEEGVIKSWTGYQQTLDIEWPPDSPCYSGTAGSGTCVPKSTEVELVRAVDA
jgi:hypothetical protein